MSIPEQQPVDNAALPEQYYLINLSAELITNTDNQFRVRSLAANFISRLHPLSTAGVENALTVKPVVMPELLGIDLAEFMDYQKTRAAVQEYRESLKLTGRETEIMDLLSQGLSHTEVAKQLYLSVATVKTHQDRIATKMGTGNRYMMTALYNGLSRDSAGLDLDAGDAST